MMAARIIATAQELLPVPGGPRMSTTPECELVCNTVTFLEVLYKGCDDGVCVVLCVQSEVRIVVLV